MAQPPNCRCTSNKKCISSKLLGRYPYRSNYLRHFIFAHRFKTFWKTSYSNDLVRVVFLIRVYCDLSHSTYVKFHMMTPVKTFDVLRYHKKKYAREDLYILRCLSTKSTRYLERISYPKAIIRCKVLHARRLYESYLLFQSNAMSIEKQQYLS